jgi:hypothetical protein
MHLGRKIMNHYGLGFLAVSSIAAIVATQPSAATQLCAGPALAGVSGAITNGSSCNLEATGSTVTELFIGKSASDIDDLNLGSTLIFNNQTTASGAHVSQSVSQGSTLGFSLTNTSDALTSFIPGGAPTFNAGTAYNNPAENISVFGIPILNQPELDGVFHFAWFNIASESDFNSLFGAKVPMTDAANSVILSNGGYSDWTFVGVEDSRVNADDDWNDTIYAFQNVAPVGTTIGGGGTTTPGTPEPSTWVMMIMGFAGLGFVGYRGSRKTAVRA